MQAIVDYVAAQARTTPDRPFLTEKEWTVSFAGFFALTRRMAFASANRGKFAAVLQEGRRYALLGA